MFLYRFSDAQDLIHRLFVCISGVADQLQTNYASDLRKILKCVFLINQSPPEEPPKSEDPDWSSSAPIHSYENDDEMADNSTGGNGWLEDFLLLVIVSPAFLSFCLYTYQFIYMSVCLSTFSYSLNLL